MRYWSIEDVLALPDLDQPHRQGEKHVIFGGSGVRKKLCCGSGSGGFAVWRVNGYSW